MDLEFLEEILCNKKYDYKIQAYDKRIKIVKIKNKVNLVFYKSKKNSFPVEEDLFFYINEQTIPYAFLLINDSNNKIFFMNYPKKENWLSNSFERSGKDEIFFGKIVLQNEIKKSVIQKKIELLCK